MLQASGESTLKPLQKRCTLNFWIHFAVGTSVFKQKPFFEYSSSQLQKVYKQETSGLIVSPSESKTKGFSLVSPLTITQGDTHCGAGRETADMCPQ